MVAPRNRSNTVFPRSCMDEDCVFQCRTLFAIHSRRESERVAVGQRLQFTQVAGTFGQGFGFPGSLGIGQGFFDLIADGAVVVDDVCRGIRGRAY